MEDSSSKNKKQKNKESKPNLKKGEIIEEGDTKKALPITERASKNLYNSIFRISLKHNGENICKK